LLALVSDGWRRAWEALEGSYARFLNDVGRAWRAAEAADEAQVKRGGSATYLGGEVRCALCRASVQSLAGNIPPALLKALVERGLWSASQGLAYARQMQDPSQRAEGLAAVAPHLPEPQRGEALARALEAARASGEEYNRSRALAALAAHLPGPQRGEALAQAARAIGQEDSRSRALAALAAHLPEPQRGEALAQDLEDERAIRDEDSRSPALAALAPHLATRPAPFLYPLWSKTLPVLASRTRRELLADLSDLLPGILRLGGLQAATEVFRAIQDLGQWWP
jgi:aminopeptidase N